jgi:hypothetical protein
MSNDLYFTTQRAGNWSREARFHDSPWWSSDEEIIGSVLEFSYPADDWSVIVRHNLTVDVDIVIGHSLQAAIWEPLAVSATAGSTVTALPTGNYTASASVFSANGETQVGNTVTASFLLTNGVSKPRITFAEVPPAGCTYRIYLSHPLNDIPNLRTLYCSGITGTTVDLVPSLWGNTWSAGVATGGAVGFGNSTGVIPSGQSSAITISAEGSIIVASGKELLIRGDLVVESPTGSTKPFVQIGSGGTFRSDPSLAVDPTRADYLMWFQGGGDIRFLG